VNIDPRALRRHALLQAACAALLTLQQQPLEPGPTRTEQPFSRQQREQRESCPRPRVPQQQARAKGPSTKTPQRTKSSQKQPGYPAPALFQYRSDWYKPTFGPSLLILEQSCTLPPNLTHTA